MMALDTIHIEMRLAFKGCARKQRSSKAGSRSFNTFPSLRVRNCGTSRAVEDSPYAKGVKNGTDSADTSELVPHEGDSQQSSRTNKKDLLPSIPKPGTLQRPRKLDVPARLLPKAQVSPELTLSPKERLQVEYETRRPPKASEKPGEHEKTYLSQSNI